MARRALELGLAIAGWQARGGRVLFATYTLRHHRGQRLGDLWSALLDAWRFMTMGSQWAKRREALGLRGWVRVVEVTWSRRNGWHVHVHALLFVGEHVEQDAADAFGAWSAARWSRSVVRAGLQAPLGVGQHVRLVRSVADGDLAAYVSKATDLGLEMTQSQSKRARRGHSTVPTWSLLSDLLDDGDADALDLWREWEQGSKGRLQMCWSKGLRRELLGQEREQTDEEIAGEVLGDEDLVNITGEGWASVVARPWLQPAILTAAESSAADLRRLLIRTGVAFTEPLEVLS